MPSFIENCNCRGIRPSGIVATKHNLRPSLTARLLNDRRLPRCIIAPGGYGKSSLAYEYAQIVFEFKHVFWVKCSSPCFIRDLDEGNLAASIFECDANARLLVCDDLPQLDFERCQALSDFVSQVLEKNCEIIICCTPSNDVSSVLDLDCIRLHASDLLLNEEEIEIERLRGIAVEDFASFGKQWMTPSYVWSDGKCEKVIAGIAQEKLPTSLKCAAFLVLLFGQGDISELAAFLRPSAFEDDIGYLAKEYPYLGIDIRNDSYQAMGLSVTDITKAFGGDIDVFSDGFLEEARGDAASLFANKLLEKGDCARAAEFMCSYSKGDALCQWAAINGWKIAFMPEPMSYLKLADKCLAKKSKLASDILTIAAWSTYILGDEDSAKRYCLKANNSLSSEWQTKGACNLMLLLTEDPSYKSKNQPSNIALRSTEKLLGNGRAASVFIDAPLDFELALELMETAGSNLDRFDAALKEHLSALEPAQSDPFKVRTLIFCGVMVLKGLLLDDSGLDEESKTWGMVERVVDLAISFLDNFGDSEKLSWPEYLAIKVIEECNDKHPFKFERAFSISDIAAMRRIDMSLYYQSSKWKVSLEERMRKKGEFELTHPDPFRRNAMKAKELTNLRAATPTLSIVLFGGLDCWIGDKRQDVRILTRDKAKSLLALMSINHGREISREKLVRMIWPDSDFEAANKNLYVVWSYLKKSLSVGDSCPYLLRTQNGFRLDTRYVSCDLDDFEDLCRALLFGRDDLSMWEEMYEKVSGRFAEDLLPAVTSNPNIDAARKMYRDQLVDGLVAASNRLFAHGEVRGATWYAREAKRRDPSREDVYIALMSAQIASDQRASALDTYFECRRYLSENMGIDPSFKIMDLYRSIIEEEHDF